MLFITQPRAGRLHNEIIGLQTMARELNWEVVGAECGWRLTDEMIATHDVGVPYGSQTFCEVISQQMNWKLIENPHDWLAKLPQEFLKRDVKFILLKEFREMSFIRNFIFNNTLFIKPADAKCFDAKVYQPGEFNPPDVVEDNTPVLISEPVEFVEEYRCFVDGERVRTVSCYLYHGEINEPKNWYNPNCLKAKEFANRVLEAVHTEPSVVDVGLIKGKGWAVLESNQAWASGMYGCDPYEVLQVIQQTCKNITI